MLVLVILALVFLFGGGMLIASKLSAGGRR